MAGDDENPYQIKRSLRFRTGATSHLARTFGTPTSQNVWTWSGWVRLGSATTSFGLFASSGATHPSEALYVSPSTGELNYIAASAGGTNNITKRTTALLRDPTAWYHICMSKSGAAGGGVGNIKLFINGAEVTAWAVNAYTGTPASVPNYLNVSGQTAYMGRYFSAYADGYLSEVNFVDGQALTPASFGMTDPVTGQWSPITFAGTYGTNGFYLDFSDPSSTANLCLDRSGNANNWTPTGISITAGATYDSMLDVPTRYSDGGNGRGNYCVLSSLTPTTAVPTNAGLSATVLCTEAGANQYARGTVAMSSGKFYWETTYVSQSTGTGGTANVLYVGVGRASSATISYLNGVFYYCYLGNKLVDGVNTAYGTACAPGVVIGAALDLTAGTITFYRNNVSQGAITLPSGTDWLPSYGNASSNAGNSAFHANFGQQPFTYTPPAGFVALNTNNLTSDTVITSGSFTGNASVDGPFVWMNGTPVTVTINGFGGALIDRLANGFKLRTAAAAYNAVGANTWTATVLSPASKSAFRKQLAKANP